MRVAAKHARPACVSQKNEAAQHAQRGGDGEGNEPAGLVLGAARLLQEEARRGDAHDARERARGVADSPGSNEGEGRKVGS